MEELKVTVDTFVKSIPTEKHHLDFVLTGTAQSSRSIAENFIQKCELKKRDFQMQKELIGLLQEKLSAFIGGVIRVHDGGSNFVPEVNNFNDLLAKRVKDEIQNILMKG